MQVRIVLFVLLLINQAVSFGQLTSVSFHANDPRLETAFDWAKQTAFSYRGKPADPVGPWYESALPPRSAFCMRDVAHQSIGGEILGMASENRNMFTLFVKNISDSRDWCSFWEINKYGKPAPEDYRNDREFWYNLNANFDVMNACWRLYLWTGKKFYIEDTLFFNFHTKSVQDYIDRWVLQVDSLLSRPLHPNAPVPFKTNDPFHLSRGLPSYSEGVPNLRLGIDLIAAIYQGFETYANILEATGRKGQASAYRDKAELCRRHIEEKWWNEKGQRYYTHIGEKGNFGNGEGETFLLWFDALKDSSRRAKTINYLATEKANVENRSYFPFLFSEFGRYDLAREHLLSLSDPNTKRREYPEVSFGVLEGIVQGLMGIAADAREQTVSSLFGGMTSDQFSIEDLPILGTTISISQETKKTILENRGEKSVNWKPRFAGSYTFIQVNGKKLKTRKESTKGGMIVSVVSMKVKPGAKLVATVD